MLPGSQNKPGNTIDRYEVIAELARGGMGTVLLARVAGAGGFARLYALKLLHKHLMYDSDFVDMLLDEESTSVADLEVFIGKSIKLQVESLYTQEQFDIILM